MEPQNYTSASILRTTLTIAAASKKIFLRPHHDDDDVDVRIPHFAVVAVAAVVVVHGEVLLMFRLQKKREKNYTSNNF